MPRPRRDPPRAFSANWPTEPCENFEAEVMRVIAANLADAVDGRSLREVGRLTGLHHTVVVAVLEGTSWVEAVTIARLERGLGSRLWPVREGL